MNYYIVYDNLGKIRRVEIVGWKSPIGEVGGLIRMKGKADGRIHKIVDGKIVDKTPEEIEVDKPPKPGPIPYEQRKANITNGQLQEILDRIGALEN